MNSQIINNTKTEVTLKITLDEKALREELAHVYDHLRPRVKVAGFRPGKAPDHIVERELGSQTVQAETLDYAATHAYTHAIHEHKLTPLAQPEVSIKKFVPYTELEFEAKVEVMPDIKMADFKKIKKAAKAVKVEQKEIDAVIEDLRRRLAKREVLDRPAKMEDEVTFDFEGKQDGKPVEGATAKNYTLKLGSNQFIPGFEKELIGLKAGDEKTFKITFPKDYHDQKLAGRPVEFTVKINKVTELNLPEINKEFAAEVGPFTSVEDLIRDITDQLTMEAEQKAAREYEDELLAEIVKKSELTLPERLVSQQLERLKVEISQRLASSGLDMEKYLEMQKKTPEEMEKELRPEAEKRVGLALILNEVSKQEGIEVTNEDIESELNELKKRYTDPAMQQELQQDRVREDVYNHLMASRAVAKLVEYAKS